MKNRIGWIVMLALVLGLGYAAGAQAGERVVEFKPPYFELHPLYCNEQDCKDADERCQIRGHGDIDEAVYTIDAEGESTCLLTCDDGYMLMISEDCSEQTTGWQLVREGHGISDDPDPTDTEAVLWDDDPIEFAQSEQPMETPHGCECPGCPGNPFDPLSACFHGESVTVNQCKACVNSRSDSQGWGAFMRNLMLDYCDRITCNTGGGDGRDDDDALCSGFCTDDADCGAGRYCDTNICCSIFD